MGNLMLLTDPVKKIPEILEILKKYTIGTVEKEGKIIVSIKPDTFQSDNYTKFLQDTGPKLEALNIGLRGTIPYYHFKVKSYLTHNDYNQIIIDTTQMHRDRLFSGINRVTAQEIAESLKFLIDNGTSDDDLKKLGVTANLKQKLLNKEELTISPLESHKQRLAIAFAKVPPQQIEESLNFLLSNGYSNNEIAEYFQIDRVTIWRCLNWQTKGKKPPEEQATENST